MPRTFMYNDASGNITEAYLHVTATSMGFASEIIGLLGPGADIYIAYSPTAEDLAEKLRQFDGEADREGLMRHIRAIQDNFQVFSGLINTKGNVSTEEIDRIQDSRIPRPVLEAWKSYLGNDSARHLITTFLYLQTAMNTGYSREFIGSLAETSGRVHVFPAGEPINDWARDRITGAVGSRGEKTIIQGKVDPENRTSNNLSPLMERNGASLAMEPFWRERGFEVVPASDVELELYEGGDIVPSENTAFIGEETYRINRGILGRTKAVGCLRKLTGKPRTVLINTLESIHSDLYLAALGENDILLGDTEPCRRIMKERRLWRDEYEIPSGQRGKELNVIARFMESKGFNIERIPFFHTQRYFCGIRNVDDHVSRSYANCVFNGKDVIVAPFGIPELDEMSAEPFESRGFNVINVGSMGTLPDLLDDSNIRISGYRRAGVRCSLNVLSRDSKPAMNGSGGGIEIETPNLLTGSLAENMRIGRNDPCPCKSGLKYKKCCGRP